MIPQRKKTAEEIAKLRETMGLPGAPASPEAPAAIPAPTPAPSISAVPEIPIPPPDPRPPVEAKPVRSLRKSERIPSPSTSVSRGASSSLPSHRRTESELNQLRRSQPFQQDAPAAHLIALTAHPLIVGAGYTFAVAAAIMPFAHWRYWFQPPFAVTAILAAIAIAIAGFIFLKKKRSVHNACFIAAIAFFIVIFSALYYFPHLRNAP